MRANRFIRKAPFSKAEGTASTVTHQNPITIPSRSHSAKLLLRRPCQSETTSCFSFASALCLPHVQRTEAMGDRDSSSIRLSLLCMRAHFPAGERRRLPAASATTNKATCSRAINFIRAFILETFHPPETDSSQKCHFEAASIAVLLLLAWRTRAEGRKACCYRSRASYTYSGLSTIVKMRANRFIRKASFSSGINPVGCDASEPHHYLVSFTFGETGAPAALPIGDNILVQFRECFVLVPRPANRGYGRS